jgi:hypothetical protein
MPQEIGDEPWNNGYVLAAATERLLRRLELGPMTDDEVDRFFLYKSDLRGLSAEKWRFESEKSLTTALWDFLKSLGRSHSFGDAIVALQDQEEQWRQSAGWNEMPSHISDLARKRAECIVSHASRERWIERIPDGRLGWRITDSGSEALRSGHFNLR